MTNWKGAPKDISNYDSFIYLIVNKNNGKKYIGQKTFWNKVKLKPLKGHKRRRINYVESDWKDYYGSSESLWADLRVLGDGAFERFILILCHNKWQKHYWEAKLQFDNEVLLTDGWYNGIIQCRINNAPKDTKVVFTKYIKMVSVK
jgi:hypothetical protein